MKPIIGSCEVTAIHISHEVQVSMPPKVCLVHAADTITISIQQQKTREAENGSESLQAGQYKGTGGGGCRGAQWQNAGS